MAGPGYTTAAAVGSEHARAVWALAAREKLLETAGEYHGLVGHGDLAQFVQERSLVRSNQVTHSWMSDVLRRVAQACAERGEPMLNALCVNQQGSVGAAYASLVEEFRGQRPEDPEAHAAEERLECYRRFGAALPPGGGEPALAPELQARRDRSRTQGAAGSAPKAGSTRPSPGTPNRPSRSARPSRATVAAEKPLVLCPVHFTELPANGVCDLCE